MASSILNSDDGVISGTSGLKSTGGDDGVLLIQTNGTTAQTVDAGQRTKFPTTIGVGGATPSTSGSGITFPATQSASSNANTLDDYEEGTYTPTIVAGVVASGTYAGSYIYTKIGNTVSVLIAQTSGTLTWGAGNAIFNPGAPFTPSTTTPVVFTDTSPYPGGTGHIDTSLRLYAGSAGTSITTLRISSTYLI